MKVRVGCKGLICALCGTVLVTKKTTTLDTINTAVTRHNEQQHDRKEPHD